MTISELSKQLDDMVKNGQGDMDVDNVSDGHHTFRSLYDQRMVLFATIVKMFPKNAWKSFRHDDGQECFGGGWFIVGVDTPEGQYTYHYRSQYWSMFECKAVEKAPKFDGHSDKDVGRVLSLVR